MVLPVPPSIVTLPMASSPLSNLSTQFSALQPQVFSLFLLNIPVSLSYSLAITYVFQCDVYRCNCCDLFEEDLLRLKRK